MISHLSQIVQLRYYMDHPEQAPESVRGALEAAGTAAESVAAGAPRQGQLTRDLFNLDDVGFPQNEESVTVCKKRPRYVVSGTNDFRGLLDPEGNFTGYYFSTDGGRTVAKEGLLPSIPVARGNLPSGGDPVYQSDEDCNIYAASLNYGPDPFNEGENGIGLYKTTLRTLQTCPAGEDPDQLTQPECWPIRRLAARAEVAGGAGQFLDKEWFDVGQSGAAGNVVWVAYADFAIDVNEPLGSSGAQIKAVRCSANLRRCTDPILISGADEDIQFADVTISESGRTLITWAQR